VTTGWCRPQSVWPGEVVELHVAGADEPPHVAVVRDGLTPRVVWSGDDVTSIPTGVDWAPGLYIVRLAGAAPTA